MEKRSISADTALRLARFFGTTAELWAGLQADYDWRLTRYEKESQIEREVEPLTTLLFGAFAIAIKLAIVQRLPPGTSPVMPTATPAA